MLGAGASAAAAAAFRVGAVPPLTTSGVGADFTGPVLSDPVLSSPVLSNPVLSEPEAFPVTGRADPGLEDAGEVGNDVESVGAVPGAVAVAGIRLGVAGLRATGAGFVGAGAAICTGWLTVVLYCV